MPVSWGLPKSLIDRIQQLFPGLSGQLSSLIPYISGDFEANDFEIAGCFRSDLLRRDDLLNLQVYFFNLKLHNAVQTGDSPWMTVIPGSTPFLAVKFPPQSFGERSFFEEGSVEDKIPLPDNDPEHDSAGVETPYLPAPIRIGGPSWLILRLKADQLPIPYTISGVLEAIRQATPVVSDTWEYPLDPSTLNENGLVHFPPPFTQAIPRQGARVFTYLETPYRLLLSPNAQTRWVHAPTAVTRTLPAPSPNDSKTRTELWHTRLGVSGTSGILAWLGISGGEPDIVETPSPYRSGRFIWSRDMELMELSDVEFHDHKNKPFRMPLDVKDRYELVRLTSDPRLPQNQRNPVQIDTLSLSALGAWLRAEGAWERYLSIPEGGDPWLAEETMSVVEWRHIQNMGRDQFVRVVYAGYLFPFGFPASLVKITERKFQSAGENAEGSVAAYLRTRMFIIIQQPFTLQFDRRSFPFCSVTIKARITPSLFNPDASEVRVSGLDQYAFWPATRVSNAPVKIPFAFSAMDWEGRTLEFDGPCIFIDSTIHGQLNNHLASPLNYLTKFDCLKYAYDQSGLNKRPFGGQRMAFAPPWKSGDTSLDAQTLTFSAELDPGPGGACFVPNMAAAEVDIPAVRSLLGVNKPATVSWEPTYLNATDGTMGNSGEVFLTLDNIDLEFDKAKTGGLVAPNIQISGLSRAFGPVDSTTQALDDTTPKGTLLDGKFAPQIFPEGVKILGGLSLQHLLKYRNVSPSVPYVPNLQTNTTPDGTTTTYTWMVDGAGNFLEGEIFKPGGGARLQISTKLFRPAAPGADTQSEFMGTLSDVSLILLPGVQELVQINFKEILFHAQSGKKMDVSVEMGAITYLGPLGFFNTLSKIIPLNGFMDPPYLDVSAEGINVGFTFGIPTIGVGIFTLQNIALGAGFFLPFGDGETNLHLAFCERHQPFILTVMGLGGGGSLAVDLNFGGLRAVELSLEFGASLALNLGVAAGAVTFMGGVYLMLAGDGFTFQAYLRAAGELEVLGIISVSIEFYLILQYQSKVPGGRESLKGIAIVTVEVEVLFFSTSVDVTLERTLSGADPHFAQIMAETDWAEYCEAFA